MTARQVARSGGSPTTLFAGVAAVSAGLGVFWYTQKWSHRQKEEDVRPGAIPTWEYRMKHQQDPKSNADDPLAQRVSGAEPVPRPKDVPLPGSDSRQSGSAAMTAAHGKGSDDTQRSPEHVDEPAQRRTNDTGDQPYTKNS
ncbi:hypothetical protein WOLCODRAFT_107273, partial [Wolfiporia cocos MD-104 SS10]